MDESAPFDYYENQSNNCKEKKDTNDISNFISNFFDTNKDSAQYMLSALVQSEAAIIAIVVTLSLVAVQPMILSVFFKV